MSAASARRSTALDTSDQRSEREHDLDEVMRGLADDAISRGLLDDRPIVPLNYRRVICLPDGSRVDVQIVRLIPCETCERIHGRDSAGCPVEIGATLLGAGRAP